MNNNKEKIDIKFELLEQFIVFCMEGHKNKTTKEMTEKLKELSIEYNKI